MGGGFKSSLCSVCIELCKYVVPVCNCFDSNVCFFITYYLCASVFFFEREESKRGTRYKRDEI